MNGGISLGLQLVSSFTHLMEGINQLLNSQAASSLSPLMLPDPFAIDILDEAPAQ